MTRTVEDRADRMMRRRYEGWVDRRSFAWSGIRLSIALRDTERALFSWAGRNVKPDWDAVWHALYLIGLVWIAVVLALLAGTWLDLWPQ